MRSWRTTAWVLVSHQNTANEASIQEIAVRHKRTPLVPMYHVQQQGQMHQAMGSNPGFQPAFQAAPLISSPQKKRRASYIILGCLIISFCLVISFASYTKIFCTLRYHQAQVRDQQQLSQTNALNMARFRKPVYSALWVQLALVVCYAPMYTVTIVIAYTKKYSLLLVVTWKVAVILLYFNSTLNPFLYCWKMSEVRQAVKQTIKEALC